MNTHGSATVGLALSLLLISCTHLTLKEVQFGWPVESVLTVDPQNRIEDRRYSMVADLTSLAAEEFEDSTALRGKEVRLLRSDDGFYFITGKGFKHVYVFEQGSHELSLMRQIQVSQTPLKAPALNQRPPHVELIDGAGLRLLLTSGGIFEEEKK